jgi:hypothetical protein
VAKIEVGDHLYEVALNITGITEYGISIFDATNPEIPLPPAGARFDIAVAGTARGQLEGTVEAVDYLLIRADRRVELHIHGVLTASNGGKIALCADGVALPEPSNPAVSQLRENVKLQSAHPELEWVNPLQIWGQGTVDMGKLEINISAYARGPASACPWDGRSARSRRGRRCRRRARRAPDLRARARRA